MLSQISYWKKSNILLHVFFFMIYDHEHRFGKSFMGAARVVQRSLLKATFCPSGDDGRGAGLPAAPSHGLPHGAAPADAGVLDEGEKPEAQILSHRQHLGQAAPQRRQPQGGDQYLLRVSPCAGRLQTPQFDWRKSSRTVGDGLICECSLHHKSVGSMNLGVRW